MFHVNSVTNKETFVPNQSHLHRATTGRPQSLIPRKVSTGKLEITNGALEKSVVHSLLQSVNCNSHIKAPQSQLYRTQHTITFSAEPSKAENRVKSLSSEFEKNNDVSDKPAVVMRAKNTEERRRALADSGSQEAHLHPVDQWQAKYEEAERKRKDWLTESQKLSRQNTTLQNQLQNLEEAHKKLQEELANKTQQLHKLTVVSEQVYQDYDNLNNKYETETTTLHKALEIASKWYKENKKLKRESIALRSSLMQTSNLEKIQDEIDGDDTQSQDELEDLRKTVQELSSEVGQLKSELNRARLLEFEAQEQLINLSQFLEEEKKNNLKLEDELQELRLMRDKFESVTYMVHDEMRALRTERDRANEAATRLQAEAQQAKKERNVLAHQSSLLMEEISSNETLVAVLLEVEALKRKLEEETQNHTSEVQKLREMLEFRETESQVEVLEEKLRLAENELELALKRVQQAEESSSLLQEKVNQLQLKLEESANEASTAPQLIPSPPPPPPPPLPEFNICIPGSRRLNIPRDKKVVNGDSLKDMANILGKQRTQNIKNVPGGAIHDIINEIKGGKFTLKATEKQKMKKEEPPPAVQEMLNIIGTLKRRSAKTALTDVK